MTTSAPATIAAVVRPRRDARGYWRWVLAVAAPLGWLTVGIVNALMPYPLGGTAAENVDGIHDHPDRMIALINVQPLFLFTFVPSVIALILACRRAMPLLTTIVGSLGLLGALAGTFNPPTDLFIVTGIKHGVDVSRLAAVADAIEDFGTGWTLAFAFLFITIGRVAVGVLLWRAQVGPRSLAALMAASPFVEFGGQALGFGNAAPAVAWIASGVAMLGVTAHLLRLPNDEFDLPPHAR